MKTVVIKDADGHSIEVSVPENVYLFFKQSKRSDETQARYDRAALVKEPLSDYHSNILLHPDENMSDMVEKAMLIEKMLSAVGRLSQYEQLLIKKRFYDNLTYAEIARDYGKSYQAIQKRINLVIARLLAELS